MITSSQAVAVASLVGPSDADSAMARPDPSRWYAVQTKARHEKAIAQRFKEYGLPTFLPLTSEIHRWSDRKKTVESPLFSCYTFVKLNLRSEQRLQVLNVSGVFHIVGIRGEGVAIPEEQIDAIRRLTEEKLSFTSHPFLNVGQRVRIRGGAMNGIEGILLAKNSDRTLVVSVEVIQRSLAVRIEGYDLEAV